MKNSICLHNVRYFSPEKDFCIFPSAFALAGTSQTEARWKVSPILISVKAMKMLKLAFLLVLSVPSVVAAQNAGSAVIPSSYPDSLLGTRVTVSGYLVDVTSHSFSSSVCLNVRDNTPGEFNYVALPRSYCLDRYSSGSWGAERLTKGDYVAITGIFTRGLVGDVEVRWESYQVIRSKGSVLFPNGLPAESNFSLSKEGGLVWECEGFLKGCTRKQ